MNQKANNFQLMRDLSLYQQAAIAATLMERMLPNYQLFAEVSEFGDSKLLRNILDLCWEWLTVEKVKINFERLAEELELVTPEVNHFDMFGVYPAVDCATALDMMLNGICQLDAAEFLNVAKISQATVARLIEYNTVDEDITTEAELKKIVREDPLMCYEMECLAELIALVTPMTVIGREQMQSLKAWVKEQGLTNLAMELPQNPSSAS